MLKNTDLGKKFFFKHKEEITVKVRTMLLMGVQK